jgi:hypothetical protein
VENIRPDVRIMNQSYLGGGWYIEQMKRRLNESDPIPFSMPQSKYMYGNFDYIFVQDIVDYRVDLAQAMAVVRSDSPNTRVKLDDRDPNSLAFDFLPQHKLSLPVNKENVLKTGVVRPEDADLILDRIDLNIQGSTLEKPEVMILDMLAHFNWERPIYFAQPNLLSNLGLNDYLQYDGFAYRLVPIKTPVESVATMGRIDTDYLYKNLMEVYRYGNVADPEVYVDNFSRYNITSTQIRGGFARLAEALIKEGDTQRALQVLDRGMEVLPFDKIPHGYQSLAYIDAYYEAGDAEKGDALARDFAHDITQRIYYYFTFPDNKHPLIEEEMIDQYQYLNHLIYSVLAPHERWDLVGEMSKSLDITDLFFGIVYNENGEMEDTGIMVNDRTRDEFLKSIDGHFVIES